MRLRVLACSGLATIQDGGRPGHQRHGLSPSGPLDPLAHAAANALVGRPPDAPAIELALAGLALRAEGGALQVALAGAPCRLGLDEEPVADHRSLVLREGAELRITPARAGVFATLALAGRLAAAPALGSHSLHLRAGLGGLDGRPLRAGDVLDVDAAPVAGEPDRALDPVPLEAGPIRVVLGPQADHFTEAGLATFLGAAFTVSNRADRMGYQLDGPEIAHARGFNIVSDATAPGSVQVPGTGRPIVLLADRQTTGGYPKIATVISADLRRLTQRRPGERVRFAAVRLEEAVRLARARADTIAALPGALRPATTAAERLGGANLAGAAVDALDPDP